MRNRRGLSTRAAILAAAHRLLKDKGFETMSLEAVARAAGVTRSSVYHQFQSRDGLFLHLIDQSLRRLQRASRSRLKKSASALERFLAESEAGFRLDPHLFRMFYLLVFDRSWNRPEFRKMLREAYRFRTHRLATALAKDDAVSPEEAETFAILLAATLDGLYVRSLIDLGQARSKRVFRLITELVGSRIRTRRKKLDSTEHS